MDINIDDKYLEGLDPDKLLEGINQALKDALPARPANVFDLFDAMTAKQEADYDKALANEKAVIYHMNVIHEQYIKQMELFQSQLVFWKAKQEAVFQEVIDNWG